MILGLLAGFLWFGVFFAAHLAVVRWAPSASKPRINQRLFLLGLAGISIGLWPASAILHGSSMARGGLPMAIVWGILSYVGLFVLYMPFYYTVVASLSICTMTMLHRKPDNRTPIAELQEQFASRRLVGQRLATMAENGFLIPLGCLCFEPQRAICRSGIHLAQELLATWGWWLDP
jgi:hypothetical protein